MPNMPIADLRRGLPGLTGGEGVVEATYAGHAPVAPVRRSR